ncbi:nuclear protein [Trapelia coarctata]|nr:nuclear protein [Trapelia coarctata]
MARLAKRPSSDDGEDSDTSTSTRQRPNRRHDNPGSLSPSPAASFSSDKENQSESTQRARDLHGKAGTMGPPKLLTPGSAESTAHSNKRRRLGDRDAPNASQTLLRQQLSKVEDLQYYDPDQPMDERRMYRKKMRELTRELNDSRTEYMAADSTGLLDTVNKCNDLFKIVKQTSDATLDSRLMVTTGELSARRARQTKIGGSSQGIDVDEFVGKCLSYMGNGAGDNGASLSGTQRRRQRDNDESGAEDSQDEGEELDWEQFGRRACFPYNIRPPVSGFLLGPLSVQKRVRKQTQRRPRLQKQDPREAIRPEEVKVKDLAQAENSNLTVLCTKYRTLLHKTTNEAEARVMAEALDDMTDEEVRELMHKHGIAENGGLPLIHTTFNPVSFGQTVENVFYLSFLIRDGYVKIDRDAWMGPTLHWDVGHDEKEIQDGDVNRRQAVFHLDYDVWEDAVVTWDIEKSIIPHRGMDEGTQVGVNGWYG